MVPKDDRGTLGKLLQINYFGDGKTWILNERNAIETGLKPVRMDPNVFRLHQDWSKFQTSEEDSQNGTTWTRVDRGVKKYIRPWWSQLTWCGHGLLTMWTPVSLSVRSC
eukprot:5207149-Amphidinium_carterae.3